MPHRSSRNEFGAHKEDSHHGRLLLAPAPLANDGPVGLIPEHLQWVRAARHFLVETPKTARQVLHRWAHPLPIAQLTLLPIPDHLTPVWLDEALAPCLNGQDAVLLSDAGAPAIADPGAAVVAAAHARAIPVVPLIGPSAILLALMGSGLPGQRFAFHGYLPVEASECRKRLRALEQESRQKAQTQLFIETPYRNDRLLALLLETLQPTTWLTLAMALTAPGGWVRTRSVAEWRQERPTVGKSPAVFAFAAMPVEIQARSPASGR